MGKKSDKKLEADRLGPADYKPAEKPISLRPLKFEEAVQALAKSRGKEKQACESKKG